MKVLPFKIPKPNDDAIVYQEDYEVIFYNKYHQHEEIQISLIVEGQGTLVVGDRINQFREGDILVIGSNLPHVFKSERSDNKSSLMLSVFFSKASFGETLFDLEELSRTKVFFKRSEIGFRATSHKQKLQSYFFQLKESSKFDRLILLFSILDLLSKTRFESLSSFKYQKQYTDLEGKRMSAIMDFIINNSHNKITLDDVAQVASMTKNSFCKYFKKRTNKTFIQFMNELRIENAHKLLNDNKELSISEIAEASGFNNMANFNRTFKSIKGFVPSAVRKAKTF